MPRLTRSVRSVDFDAAAWLFVWGPSLSRSCAVAVNSQGWLAIDADATQLSCVDTSFIGSISPRSCEDTSRCEKPCPKSKCAHRPTLPSVPHASASIQGSVRGVDNVCSMFSAFERAQQRRDPYLFEVADSVSSFTAGCN